MVQVKRICTVGLVLNADPEQVQREADSRFKNVHQFYNETVPAFYDRFLQEVSAWVQAGNAFIEVEIIMEGDDPDQAIDEENPRVRAARARLLERTEKKMAFTFLSKLDRNRFMSLNDDLANLAKGRNAYPSTAAEAMQLAQTYRSDGRVIGDTVSGGKSIDESAYVTQEYHKKTKAIRESLKNMIVLRKTNLILNAICARTKDTIVINVLCSQRQKNI